ncbi:MAG: protein of unknown function (DUF429) [halophilic archaeon J07HB67]|nr:MAG: protein of unknown function (DUF429) [halophilic archaeon J07HB67]
MTFRVVGVDFSAAARSAGDNTWLAVCRRTDTGLDVRELATATELLDTDGSREETLPALVEFLADPPAPTAVGLDVPFALPAEFLGFGGDTADPDRVDPAGLWAGFAADTPDEWGVLGEIDGPEELYERVRETAETRGFPRTRATDETHGGQEPAGYRIRTQTFYGVSAVLAPLVDRGARVVPVHPDPDAELTVLETYPAAVFDALPDATREGYKSDSRAGVAARGRNRAALRAAGVTVDGTAADCLTATDDALDAVAAAYAAASDYAAAVEGTYTPRERVEAVIFDGTAGD